MKYIALVVVFLVAAVAGLNVWRDHTAEERGSALYHGDAPLAGKLAGNATALPLSATRCINCHEKTTTPPAGSEFQIDQGSSSGKGTYAPVLNRTWLLTPRSRHGGPASAYDAPSLCKLLQTGIDPVDVVVPPAMPRYDASQQQCSDLFAYFSHRL